MSVRFETAVELVLYYLRNYLKDLNHLNEIEPKRETSLAITRLEESIYWLDKAHSLSMKETYNA